MISNKYVQHWEWEKKAEGKCYTHRQNTTKRYVIIFNKYIQKKNDNSSDIDQLKSLSKKNEAFIYILKTW
jgi:hypothetical protein